MAKKPAGMFGMLQELQKSMDIGLEETADALDRMASRDAASNVIPIRHDEVGNTPYTRNTINTGNTVTPVLPATPLTPPVTLPLNTPSEKQLLVLENLIGNASRLTSYNTIGGQVGMSKKGVFDAVTGLKRKGFVISILAIRESNYQGFRYMLDEDLCRSISDTPYTRNTPHTAPHTRNTGVTHNTPSSSRLLEDLKPTTKTGILDEPELRYWAGEGITEKQVSTWASEFGMSDDEITASLRFARFDILERGDVQNPANWFYKILARNCCYPRPANYRSPLEIRAEQMREQQERDEAARAKIAEAEFEARFREFIQKPNDPLYQTLFDGLSEFAKSDARATEIELREAFMSHKKVL